ncbi:hypothetical protein N300_00825, partial [Calypte anna]
SLITIVSVNKTIPYNLQDCLPLLPISVSMDDVPLRTYIRTDRKDEISM